MGKMFFWMTDPPDINITAEQWTPYMNDIAAVCLVAVIVGVLAILLAYRNSANSRKIYEVADLFRPYTPLRWLLLAPVVGLVVGLWSAYRYHDQLPPDVPGLWPTAVQVGLWTALWVLLLADFLIMFTGITPSKFKYRARSVVGF